MVTSLPTSYPCFVKAIYSWSGEEKRDLGFVEGDVIEVLNTGDGNWWMGRLKRNKMVGSFPCNFVEFLEEQKEPSPVGEQPKVQSKRSTATATASATRPMSMAASQQPQQFSQPQPMRPRSEILDDITNALNSSFQPQELDYGDHETSESSEDDREDGEDFDVPPPVPPPHSVSYGSNSNNRKPNLDRTPSPLRHAMDDVLASLGGFDSSMRTDDELSGSNSASFTAVEDEPVSRYHSPVKKTSNTTITESYAQQMYYEQEQKFQNLHRQNRHERNNSSFALNNFIAVSDEDEENYIPFDPSSYNNSKVARQGTYQSINSLKSLSVTSDSTTPTSMSNMSATSAGSLARRKQEQVRRSPTPGGGGTISEPHTITEVPVKLPNAKNSDSKSAKGLKLKRSAGYLKKLFTGTNADYEKDRVGSNGSLTRARSIKSAKSAKSVKSGKSRFSVSSSTFKNGIKKIGKKAGLTNELYPSKSFDMGNSWIETRRDVHRANTLTKPEKEQRRKNREMEGITLLQPLKTLSECVKGNETLTGFTKGEGRLDPRCQDFSHVDAAIFSMHTWPQLMSPSVFASSRIGRQFEYDIDRLRAVFDFCASKLVIERYDHDDYENYDDEEEGENQEVHMSMSKVMQSKRGTVHEITECIKLMCEALEIHCEVVSGRLKVPGEIADRASIPRQNHYWNAVIINDEWRFIDACLASPSFPGRDMYYQCDKGSSVNHFYFMTPPNEFIYTHVPIEEMEQHLVPPLNTADALALPLASPVAFEHNLSILDFQTSDVRLTNYDTCELNVSIPHGVDISCEVSCGNEMVVPGLAQVYWESNRRYARIKALLPDPYSQGVLQIYTSDRNAKASQQLTYSIGLTHAGQNAPYEFVTRHPTPHCKRQDIYVVQPQCKKLCANNSYVFTVRQHPSGGITAGSGFARTKLGVQSPSGKIYKLHRKGGSEDGLVFGTWETNIKAQEVGTWRGLVLADRGNAWSVFAEWYCI